MSNRIMLNAVKVEFLIGDVAYGFIMSDDYQSTTSLYADSMIEDDIELLKHAIEFKDGVADELLDFIQEIEKGIEINGTWYDWEDIKQYF